MRNRTNKRKNNKKRKRKFNTIDVSAMADTRRATVVFFIVILLVVLGFFSVIFAVMNIPNTNIIQGVYINGVDISNKSKEEVKTYFTEILNEKKYDGINIIHNDEEYVLELGLLEIRNDLNQILDEATKLGRSGNILKDNYEIITTFLFNKNYDLTLDYNKENLETELNWIYNELPDRYRELDYYIEDSQLILSKSVSGIIIKEDSMVKEIEKYLNDYLNSITSIPLIYEVKIAEDINVDDIYKDIYVEAKNAYYVENPFQIYPEVKGIDFAISTEEINTILNSNTENNEYVIPLKITIPNITLANLSIDVFPNVLAKAEGVYDVTNYNRANNLTIAGNKINEVVLAPGETFSYNKVLGARTIAAGYKEAAIYVSGKVVDGLGGGICQISTILYNAVLKANLEIVERKCHQFLPGYAKPGLDATVAYGSIDFRFKNNRSYPIKIKTNVVAGVAEIEILGIKEETDVNVVLENKVLEDIKYETKYVTNKNLEAGTTKLVQAGSDGKVVETYKITYKAGVETSKELISLDKYDALEEIIEKN